MEHIVYLDRKPIPQYIHFRAPLFPHTWQEYDGTPPEKRAEYLKKATIAISNKVVLDAPLLAKLPQLKLIALTATGFNHIDLDYCQKHAISVCNIRDYANQSVAEHTFALLFALRRRLREYQQDIAAGKWQENSQFCFFNAPIRDIKGSTLAIIGAGSLGQAVAQMGQALGMKVIFAERKNAKKTRIGFCDFYEAIEQADVISIHCPLNPDTLDLIHQKELNKMKPDAIVINTARGGIVNEKALINALLENKIAGAGIDVCSKEPPSLTHPFMQQLHLPNLLLTPHVAWGSDTALQTLANQLIDNIEAFVAGQPQHLVKIDS